MATNTSTDTDSTLARGIIAGTAATRAIPAARVLYATGGKDLLSEGAQQLLRRTASSRATTSLASSCPGLLKAGEVLAEQGLLEGGKAASKQLAGTAGSALARETVRGAARQIGGQLGRAAGVGMVMDAGLASFEAVRAYRRGDMSRDQALRHVALEGGTGAAATAVGAGAGAALVALVAAPALPVFLTAGSISIGTKLLLRRWVG